MLQVAPTRTNPIYVEWKRWFYECQNNYTTQAALAKASIERIAQHVYEGKNTAIVGTMIMMKDEEEMESEETSEPKLKNRLTDAVKKLGE